MNAIGNNFVQACEERRQRIKARRVQTPVPMMLATLPDLPESWCWTSLSALCERVSVGHVGPTSEFFCDPPDGVPLIRSQDVRPGRLTLASVAHIVDSFHEKLKKSQLKSGDILIVRVGANRGDCCVVPEGVRSLNCANIVFARPVLPNPFLGFYFNSEFGQSLLISLTTGSAQGVLNTQSIATIPVPVPPLPTQRKIASILSAYDDLIENNTRRIAILEEMAQAIYREWFVNFRFPGHENVKLVDSPLGQIPEGWEVLKLADCCKLVMGQSPKSEFYNETGEGLPFHQGVTNFGPRYPTHKTFCTVKNRLADQGDILFSVRAPVGRINIANTEIIVGRGVSAIRRNDDAQVFLFHQLKDEFKEEDIMGGGTIFKSVTKNDLATLPLVNPPADVLAAFESAVGASFTLYDTLTRKNAILRNTRDLLLPKLISGKLDVENLDIDVGMTAEALEEVTA